MTLDGDLTNTWLLISLAGSSKTGKNSLVCRYMNSEQTHLQVINSTAVQKSNFCQKLLHPLLILSHLLLFLVFFLLPDVPVWLPLCHCCRGSKLRLLTCSPCSPVFQWSIILTRDLQLISNRMFVMMRQLQMEDWKWIGAEKRESLYCSSLDTTITKYINYITIYIRWTLTVGVQSTDLQSLKVQGSSLKKLRELILTESSGSKFTSMLLFFNWAKWPGSHDDLWLWHLYCDLYILIVVNCLAMVIGSLFHIRFPALDRTHFRHTCKWDLERTYSWCYNGTWIICNAT